MTRRARVLWVTAGLVAAGGALGAIAGAAAITLALLLTDGADGVFPAAILFAAIVGAALGMVAGPTIAWSLLRRVPLGRMFVGSVAGTVVGGVLGWIGATMSITSPLWTALAGCLAAAMVMRRRALG